MLTQNRPYRWFPVLLVSLFLPLLAQPADGKKVAIPETHAGAVLSAWLAAHNRGEEQALRAFVTGHYTPDLLAKIDLEAHVGFYREAVPMFGRLAVRPHRVTVSEKHRLVVQLLQQDLTGPDRLSPENIVVVEIDMDPDHPSRMARGLGLGSLACMARRDESRQQ